MKILLLSHVYLTANLYKNLAVSIIKLAFLLLGYKMRHVVPVYGSVG